MLNDAMAILRNNYDPKPVADYPLIAWDEVPEGHDVWIRAAHWRTMPDVLEDWSRASKGADGTLRSTTGALLDPTKYEFAAAEQQPGEWAAKVAELTQERDDWKRSFIEANKAAEAAVDLADLRDGLAALEQEMREHHASGQLAFDFQLREWADRLAALREGQA